MHPVQLYLPNPHRSNLSSRFNSRSSSRSNLSNLFNNRSNSRSSRSNPFNSRSNLSNLFTSSLISNLVIRLRDRLPIHL